MAKKTITSVTAKLTGKLLFQSLFNKQEYINGEFVTSENGKFSTTLLIDKNSPSGKKLTEALRTLDSNIKRDIEKARPCPIGGSAKTKHFISDGDNEDHFTKYDEDLYAGNWVLSLKSTSKAKRLSVFDNNGDMILKDDDDTIKSLCYNGALWTVSVNIIYVQQNEGIYGQIRGMKFSMHSEKLTADDSVDVDELEADEEDILYFDESY